MKMTIEEYANANGVSYWAVQRRILSGEIKAKKEGQAWQIDPLENKGVVLHKYKGYSSHPLYGTWNQMKNRCSNPNNREYKWYGGKGIKVCDEWKNGFEAFLNWAELNGCAPGLTLDRIDPNGDYCPHNCRWATAKEQGEMKTNSRKPKSPITATITVEEKELLKAKALAAGQSMSGYVHSLIVSDISR